MRTLQALLFTAVFATFFCSSSARAGILSSDIEAWYGLDGNAQDNGSGGHHGVNNGATFISDGVRGTVASFDGTSSFIDVSASSYSINQSNAGGQFALSFWFKPTARDDVYPGNGTDFNAILGNTGSGVIEIVGDRSWGNMGGVTGSLGLNSGGGRGSAANVAGIDVYDGDWHHAVIQWVDPDGSVGEFTGADATFYLDGQLATDSNGTTYNGNGTNHHMVLGGPLIGSQGGAANDYYLGLLSDVVLYNRQLEAGEIPEAMAMAISPVPEPGTVALLGLGCLGMGAAALRRRRKGKAAA